MVLLGGAMHSHVGGWKSNFSWVLNCGYVLQYFAQANEIGQSLVVLVTFFGFFIFNILFQVAGFVQRLPGCKEQAALFRQEVSYLDLGFWRVIKSSCRRSNLKKGIENYTKLTQL